MKGVTIVGKVYGYVRVSSKESNNKRRFFTGILGGFGTSMLYIHFVKTVIFKSYKRR